MHFGRLRILMLPFLVGLLFIIGAFTAQTVKPAYGFGVGLSDKAEFMGLQCGDPEAGLRKCCNIPGEIVKDPSDPQAQERRNTFVAYNTNFKGSVDEEKEGTQKKKNCGGWRRLTCAAGTIAKPIINAGKKVVTDPLGSVLNPFSIIKAPFDLLVGIPKGFVEDLFNWGGDYLISWTERKVGYKIAEQETIVSDTLDSVGTVDARCKYPSVSTAELADAGLDASYLKSNFTVDPSWGDCYCVLPKEIDFDKLRTDVKDCAIDRYNACTTLASKSKVVADACFKGASSEFNKMLNDCNKIKSPTEKNACKSCVLGYDESSANCAETKNVNGVWTALGCIKTNPQSFVQTFVNGWLIGVAGGLVFIILLYVAFLYMTSRGNPEKLKKAREYLNSALMGLALIIFSVLILQLFGVHILKLPGFN